MWKRMEMENGTKTVKYHPTQQPKQTSRIHRNGAWRQPQQSASIEWPGKQVINSNAPVQCQYIKF